MDYETGNYAGRWFELRLTHLTARETYREGLLNIRAQSRRSVSAAGCKCELCWRMVMLFFLQLGRIYARGDGKATAKCWMAKNLRRMAFVAGWSAKSAANTLR